MTTHNRPAMLFGGTTQIKKKDLYTIKRKLKE